MFTRNATTIWLHWCQTWCNELWGAIFKGIFTNNEGLKNNASQSLGLLEVCGNWKSKCIFKYAISGSFLAFSSHKAILRQLVNPPQLIGRIWAKNRAVLLCKYLYWCWAWQLRICHTPQFVDLEIAVNLYKYRARHGKLTYLSCKS